MKVDLRHRMVAMLPRLRAFALSLTRQGAAADDLVQAACERALRSIATYQDGTNFEAWMLRILRNLWIDGFRRNRDEVLLDPQDPEHESVGEDGRDVTESRLTLGAVWHAIEALPEIQRSVLVLVCVEGLSYREVAEILDIPPGTVMSRLARARASVSDALAGGGSAAVIAMERRR